jgi:hypothetical protein
MRCSFARTAQNLVARRSAGVQWRGTPLLTYGSDLLADVSGYFLG